MVQRTMDAFGRVDVLVNNAGVGNYKSFLKTSVKEWDLVMDIDLRASFICSKAVAPIMVNQSGAASSTFRPKPPTTSSPPREGWSPASASR